MIDYLYDNMNRIPDYTFNLPPEEQVIKRNRTITTYYAQLYQNEPKLYKWAGMAVFASFHIGEKMKLWDWENSGIQPLLVTNNQRSKSLEDDFQIIRIINNTIFMEIGWVHLAFAQMGFSSFKALLLEKNKHPLIIHAFEKLQNARQQLKQGKDVVAINNLIWEANVDILWHEQSEVVQPLFDRLSELFSRAMNLFASFDYKVNHHETTWKTQSRFILFMIFNGISLLKKNYFLPEVTDLQQRWHWISGDLLKKWKVIESNNKLVALEIELLSRMEERSLLF
jgi:hypothetical protein